MIKYIIRSSYKRGQIFTPVKSHSNTVLKYETSQDSTYSTQLRKANIFRLSNFENFAFFKTNYMRCRRKLLQNFTCPAAYFCLPWAIRELDMLSHAVQQKHMHIIKHGIYKIPFNILINTYKWLFHDNIQMYLSYLHIGDVTWKCILSRSWTFTEELCNSVKMTSHLDDYFCRQVPVTFWKDQWARYYQRPLRPWHRYNRSHKISFDFVLLCFVVEIS